MFVILLGHHMLQVDVEIATPEIIVSVYLLLFVPLAMAWAYFVHYGCKENGRFMDGLWIVYGCFMAAWPPKIEKSVLFNILIGSIGICISRGHFSLWNRGAGEFRRSGARRPCEPTWKSQRLRDMQNNGNSSVPSILGHQIWKSTLPLTRILGQNHDGFSHTNCMNVSIPVLALKFGWFGCAQQLKETVAAQWSVSPGILAYLGKWSPKAHFSLHQPGEALFDHGAIHTLCLHSGSGFGEPILINTDCSTNGYDCHPGWLHVRCHHVVDSGLPCLYAHRPDSRQRSPTALGEVTQWGAESFKGAKWAYIVSRCRAVANVHLTFNMRCPLKFESGSVIHSEILPMRYPLSCTTQTKLLFGWTPAALWFVAYQLINHEVSMYCSLSERSLGWELRLGWIGCWRLFVGSVWVQTT